MEQEAKRIFNSLQAPKSYWLERKREREALAKEKNEQALELLEKACKFYDETYPKSKKGITYEEPKGKLPKISFELNRDDALIFKRVLEYYKTEAILSVDAEWKIGHAFWRINKNIPDLPKINRILSLEKKKKDIDKEIHRLKNMKVDTVQKIEVVKEAHFICHICDKEFVGENARWEMKEHAIKVHPMGRETEPIIEKKEIEKLFTCNLCGIQLNRNDMKDHAMKGGCKTIEEPKKEETKEEVSKFICKECGKDCKNGAGIASHLKTHEKE